MGNERQASRESHAEGKMTRQIEPPTQCAYQTHAGLFKNAADKIVAIRICKFPKAPISLSTALANYE